MNPKIALELLQVVALLGCCVCYFVSSNAWAKGLFLGCIILITIVLIKQT